MCAWSIDLGRLKKLTKAGMVNDHQESLGPPGTHARRPRLQEMNGHGSCSTAERAKSRHVPSPQGQPDCWSLWDSPVGELPEELVSQGDAGGLSGLQMGCDKTQH